MMSVVSTLHSTLFLFRLTISATVRSILLNVNAYKAIFETPARPHRAASTIRLYDSTAPTQNASGHTTSP